eukprot:CAMPEP_0113850128 /NCGR_PEP_ID=MMETSP0372-20130328/3637_1 /TAXON_ID=340204 /ORGANISM="Lankesteria abbotti" /LENGTH=281 /DNA_ID=CAMNT_0000820241 /DNA_START=161 /DNA_END=1006 /DNA_ORIENTATION=+ /assembly_acc=CAM_ASM_000359
MTSPVAESNGFIHGAVVNVNIVFENADQSLGIMNDKPVWLHKHKQLSDVRLILTNDHSEQLNPHLQMAKRTYLFVDDEKIVRYFCQSKTKEEEFNRMAIDFKSVRCPEGTVSYDEKFFIEEANSEKYVHVENLDFEGKISAHRIEAFKDKSEEFKNAIVHVYDPVQYGEDRTCCVLNCRRDKLKKQINAIDALVEKNKILTGEHKQKLKKLGKTLSRDVFSMSNEGLEKTRAELEAQREENLKRMRAVNAIKEEPKNEKTTSKKTKNNNTSGQYETLLSQS